VPPIHSAATLRHSPAQREQQAEGAARRRKRETAPSEQFGTPRRRRPPPPSSSPSSRRASRHCEPPARHQVTAALPSFDPTTAGKPQLPLAFATRALVPWPPSPARPKHHLALFSHAHRTLARSTHPGREQGPAFAEPPRKLQRKRLCAFSADMPWSPARAHPGGEPKAPLFTYHTLAPHPRCLCTQRDATNAPEPSRSRPRTRWTHAFMGRTPFRPLRTTRESQTSSRAFALL